MNTHRSSAGRDYAIGGVLIVLAVVALCFLDGATAVFTAVIAGVAGAVLFIMGVQAGDGSSGDAQLDDALGTGGPLGTDGLRGTEDQTGAGSGFDWDADFQRDLGKRDYPGEPRA